MAYVNVAEWKPEQVTEWLKGLDSVIIPYIHSFLNNEVTGKQLLNLGHDGLERLGIFIIGHQEIILEAIEHLRNFHYELDRENLQLLALRLSSSAHSLKNELRHYTDSRPVSTRILCDVANVINAVKPLVFWLDRPPFLGQNDYEEKKTELLKLSLEIATCAQRDRFAEHPIETIRDTAGELAELADRIIQDIKDPLILQPASLELVTLKKRAGEDLGFFILPSYNGVHEFAEIRYSSSTHQAGKIEDGDEVVQVNYQTVVGWQTKKITVLFEESLTDVFLTLKKRPRHTKVYGQIYIKPYRLPSKKRALPYTRWDLPSPRLELLTLPDIDFHSPRLLPHILPPQPKSLLHVSREPVSAAVSEDEDDEEEDDEDDESFLPNVTHEGQVSPDSVTLYLPKPRTIVQRRATVTGVSPTSKRPPVDIEQLWAELYIEHHWKEGGSEELPPWGKNTFYRLREKSASFGNNLSMYPQLRPTTCLGIENAGVKRRVEKYLDNGMCTAENKELFKQSMKTEIKSGSGNITIPNQPDTSNNNETEKSIDFKIDVQCEDSESKNSDVKYSADCDHNGNDDAVSDLSTIDSQNTKPESKVFSISSTTSGSEMFLTEIKLQIDGAGNTICENFERNSEANKVSSIYLPKTVPDKIICNEVAEKTPQVKERGKIDKCYSTPAYDLTDSKEFEVNGVDQEIKEIPNTFNNKPIPRFTISCQSELDGKSEEPITAGMINEIADDGNRQPGNVIASETHSHGNKTAVEVHGYVNVPLITVPLSDDEKHVPVSTNNVSDCSVKAMSLPHEYNATAETVQSNEPKTKEEIKKPNTSKGQTTDENENSSSLKELISDVVVFTASNTSHSPQNQSMTQSAVIEKPDAKITVECPSLQVLQLAKTTESLQAPCKCSTLISESAARPPKALLTTERKKMGFPFGIGYKAALIAKTFGIGVGMKGLHVNTVNTPSPRSLRKRNILLSKRRNISVNELDATVIEGWLAHRRRSGGASGGIWKDVWVIIKGPFFYVFKSRDEPKALIMISLPGFTVGLADEVKSKQHAFKIYHTGTAFYFAADCEAKLIEWMDCLCLPTMQHDCIQHDDNVLFTESEDDDDLDDNDSQTSTPKKKKKDLSDSSHSLTKDAKGNDQKKYSSLKKMVSKNTDNSDLHDAASTSSLDRKGLGLFGGRKCVPIPTEQYRSYRRPTPFDKMDETLGSQITGSSSNKLNMSTQSLNFSNDILESKTQVTVKVDVHGATSQKEIREDRKKHSGPLLNTPNISCVAVKNKSVDRPVLPPPRQLKSAKDNRDHHIHSSNPSLQHTGDINDYRRATEFLKEFELTRGAPKDDFSGFITLEQLMLGAEPGKKKKPSLRSSSHSESSNSSTVQQHNSENDDPNNAILSVESSTECSRRYAARNARRHENTANRRLRSKDRSESQACVSSKPKNMNYEHDAPTYRYSASQNMSVKATSKGIYTPEAAIKSRGQDSVKLTPKFSRVNHLKSASQYQPPPFTQSSSSKKVHPKSTTIKPAFEMHFGESTSKEKPEKESSMGKLFSFLPSSSKKHKNVDSSSLHSSVTLQSTSSSKSHGSLFKGKRRSSPKSSPSDIACVSSPLSGDYFFSDSSVSTRYYHDESACKPTQPTMGVSMLAKTSSRQYSQTDGCEDDDASASLTTVSPDSDSSSVTYFQGIALPPVFEAETYSFSNFSSLFKSRKKGSSKAEHPQRGEEKGAPSGD